MCRSRMAGVWSMFRPVFALWLFTAQAQAAAQLPWREDFDDRQHWRDWQFAEVPHHTGYRIVREGGAGVLRIAADHSASALLLDEPFSLDAATSVRLRWRWRVDALPAAGDVRRKSGDDYALRIYVIFEQPGRDAGWLARWAMRRSRLSSDGYLPERSLVYVRVEQAELRAPFPSPYTDRQMVIPKPYPASQRGHWAEVEVSPLADYQAVFGQPAPRRFRLAIMGDADNSGSASLAWLDWIELK